MVNPVIGQQFSVRGRGFRWKAPKNHSTGSNGVTRSTFSYFPCLSNRGMALFVDNTPFAALNAGVL